MTARVVVLVLAWLVAVAGCTTPSDPPSPPATASSSEQQGPRDRDEDAVLAAVRRVDLCAVLAEVPSLPPGAKPVAPQPFGCVVEGLADEVSANVVTLDRPTRLSLPTQAIGDVKAYVRDGGTGCAVFLPVSFELAVELSATTGDCQVVTELATASVAVLADPDAARVDPRWDACTVLAEALGPDTDRAKLAGRTLDDCTDFSETPSQAAVSFAAGLPPSGQPRTATVGGARVQVYEGDTCDVYWRQEPLVSRFAQTPDHSAHVTTLDCDRAVALAGSVMTVLAEPPPDGVAAQRPLFYAPDEPDSPLPGACAYAEGVAAAGCQPYREVPVPADIVDSFDAHVMCAVAVEAVREHFGPGLRPVAVTDSGINDCYFVEPERTIQLMFVVRPGLVSRRPGDREVSVAGHPGFVLAATGSSSYQLSTSREGDGQAWVELDVATGPVTAADTPLPAGTDTKAEAVLADVLEKYFP